MSQSITWLTGSPSQTPPSLPVPIVFNAAQLVGALDGVNATFTIVPAPVNGLQVFLNGVLLTQGAQPAGQYTWNGTVLTFQPQSVPQPDMMVQVFTW